MIGLNLRSGSQEGKTCVRTTPSASGEALPLHGEDLMWCPVLVMRRCVDTGGRHLVAWSEWPTRHTRSGQGTKLILWPDLFSINDSIALIPRISAAQLEQNLNADTEETLKRGCLVEFCELPLFGGVYKRFKQLAGNGVAIKILFRMPLHCENIMLGICALDGFNHSIFRALGCHPQTVAYLLGSLMMTRIHADLGSRRS